MSFNAKASRSGKRNLLSALPQKLFNRLRNEILGDSNLGESPRKRYKGLEKKQTSSLEADKR